MAANFGSSLPAGTPQPALTRPPERPRRRKLGRPKRVAARGAGATLVFGPILGARREPWPVPAPGHWIAPPQPSGCGRTETSSCRYIDAAGWGPGPGTPESRRLPASPHGIERHPVCLRGYRPIPQPKSRLNWKRTAGPPWPCRPFPGCGLQLFRLQLRASIHLKAAQPAD